jgi:CRISPR-associated protein Csb3
MGVAEANIAIPVDLTNPGQFFACCGLLELADRRWPNAEISGWFDNGTFFIRANGPECCRSAVLSEFAKTLVLQLDPSDNAASSLLLAEPFNLRLDWWRKVETTRKESVDLDGGEQLKPWAGKQFGPLIFRLMKAAVAGAAAHDAPLDYAAAVYDSKNGKEKKKTISPFYFDSRREGTGLDIGFSPDEQDMSVEAYPAVESLALVGLQRFRPQVDESRPPRSFLYTAWAEPLPPTIAGVAACAALRVRSLGQFRFTKPSRGGEYMAMFSRATRERSIL